MADADPKQESFEREKLVLDAWKKVVQTQEHFNDTCMKVRTLYATVVAAILSLYGLTIKQSSTKIKLVYLDIDPIIPILLAISIATWLFYFADKYWYHRFLLGAVEQGIQIEKDWGERLPEITMGSKIAAKSPVDISRSVFWRRLAELIITDQRLKDTGMLHSDAKIELFYKPMGIIPFIVACFVAIVGGISHNGYGLPQVVQFLIAG